MVHIDVEVLSSKKEVNLNELLLGSKRCHYCGKPSKGTFCSHNCAANDIKYNGTDR